MKANFDNIYEHTGYLFYALAAERGALTPADCAKLRTSIDKHWCGAIKNHSMLPLLPLEHLYDGVRIAYQESFNAVYAYSSFENCFNVHKLQFARSLREKILATAHLIVKKFSGDTHQSALLKELDILLELHPTLH